jgi:hypothetical protein
LTQPLLLCSCQQLYNCTGKSNQRWQKDADGALRPMHALQLCLGVAGGLAAPGAATQVMLAKGSCNMFAAQVTMRFSMHLARLLWLCPT